MRNSFFSMMMYLVVFILIQYLLRAVLMAFGLPPLMFMIVFDLILAFLFAMLQYPSIYRKQALKDPRFHMSFAIYFALLILLDLIF